MIWLAMLGVLILGFVGGWKEGRRFLVLDLRVRTARNENIRTYLFERWP